MARGLTKKEKGFVKDYVKTGNGTRSVLNNYNTKSENTAGVIANQNLRKDKIQKAIKSIADSIPDSLLIEKHLELLNATVAGEEGERPDTQAVKAGLDMAYKIKGTYAPIKTKDDVTIHSNIDDLTTEQLESILQGRSEEGTG
jgi:phage terminase small subunit